MFKTTPYPRPPVPTVVAPQATPPPPDPVDERLVRIETRLVRLMAHLGLDAEGNPVKRPGHR